MTTSIYFYPRRTVFINKASLHHLPKFYNFKNMFENRVYVSNLHVLTYLILKIIGGGRLLPRAPSYVGAELCLLWKMKRNA